MKKLLILFLCTFLITSCSKDKDEDKTTFQLINDSAISNNSSDKYLDGSIYEVVVFCFIGDNVVKEFSIDVVKSGGAKSEKIEIPAEYEKLKVSFKLLPKASPNYNMSANSRKYTVSYYMLTRDKNNEIVLNGQTMIQNSLKSYTKSAESVSFSNSLNTLF